jgi:hypothetical protein
VEIDCPPQCKYFKEHEEYQRARLGPEFHRAWLAAMEPFYRERREDPLDFVVFLEIAVYGYFAQQTRGTDEGLLEALEYARRKLGPIEIIETPASPLGKRLWEAIEEFMKKKHALDPEEAQEAVEALAQTLRSIVVEGEPRRALHGLLGHVEQFIGVPPELEPGEGESDLIATPKIIRPGEEQ